MVTLMDALLEKLSGRKNNVLLFAQCALPEHQFIAFRKLFLNEFGRGGFEGDLQKMLSTDSRNGKDRAGQNYAKKEVP